MYRLAILGKKFEPYYQGEGRPGVTTRLMVGIHLLKHIHKLSDEQVCQRWEENPYFQYFCGESFFQHKLPMSRSSMSHWRGRVGEEAVVILLQETLAVAARTQAMKPKKTSTEQSELFMNRLSNQLNPRDLLIVLASQINWSSIEQSLSSCYTTGAGRQIP